MTFLFTDIEGSTKLAQEHPKEMPALLARHHEILNQSIETHHGFVFRIVGDSFSAAFDTASDALSAALNAQRNFQNESWSPAPGSVHDLPSKSRRKCSAGFRGERGKPGGCHFGIMDAAPLPKIYPASPGQTHAGQRAYSFARRSLPAK